MKELSVVLHGFREATRCDAGVWVEARGGGGLAADAASSPTLRAPPADQLPDVAGTTRAIQAPDGETLVVAVPGPRRAWLSVGPCEPGTNQCEDPCAGGE